MPSSETSVRISALISLAMLSAACDVLVSSGEGKLQHASSAQTMSIEFSSDGEEVSAKLSSASKETQVIVVPAGSSIAGVTTSFPPGSLGIDSAVSIAPGAEIVDADTIDQDLGASLGAKIGEVGTSVTIAAGVAMDTTVPFTLAIPINKTNLTQGSAYYAVIFKSQSVSGNSLNFGVIPNSEITVRNGMVEFKTKNFGTFQVVTTDKPVVNKVEKKLAVLEPVNPATISTVKPFVAKAGERLTVTGKDFTGQMVMTIAGLKASKVDIKSDVSASFIVPKTVPHGFTDLAIEQAGAKTTYKLIAQANDKLNYPLATLDVTGVCSGVKYYNAQGVLKTGTKDCSVASSTSDLDVDGDNVADAAAFAIGKEGSGITATSAASVPANGSFFKVSGTNDINSFTGGTPGQIITLLFNNALTLNNSETALRLKGAENALATDGDVMQFVNIGNDRWVEVARNFKPRYTELFSSSNFAINTGGYVPVEWDGETHDVQGLYDYGTDKTAIIISEAGQYTVTVFLKVNGDHDQYCSYPSTYAYVGINGGNATGLTNGNCASDHKLFDYQGVESFAAGDSVTVRVNYSAASGAITVDPISYIRIEKL